MNMLRTSNHTRLKAVIFDLDGVIVSTAGLHYLAWKKIAEQENIEFNEGINERLKGVSRTQSLDIILEKATRDYSASERQELADRKNNFYVELLDSLKPSDFAKNVKTLIDCLKNEGIKTAIYSVSKNADLVIEKLEARALFDAIVSGKDIKNSKPHPEGFLIAAERLHLLPQECLVIEDAAAGIEAAKKAEMKSIGIGSNSILHEADVVLSSIQSLSFNDVKTAWSKNEIS
ncbi:MAG: beta-phosphoglucomutase [Phycisphaerales bacterium]